MARFARAISFLRLPGSRNRRRRAAAWCGFRRRGLADLSGYGVEDLLDQREFASACRRFARDEVDHASVRQRIFVDVGDHAFFAELDRDDVAVSGLRRKERILLHMGRNVIPGVVTVVSSSVIAFCDERKFT